MHYEARIKNAVTEADTLRELTTKIVDHYVSDGGWIDAENAPVIDAIYRSFGDEMIPVEQVVVDTVNFNLECEFKQAVNMCRDAVGEA